MLNLKPLPGFALIKPITKTKNEGFITVSETGEKQVEGEVVDLGETIKNEFGVLVKPRVCIGDRVIHKSFGTEIFKFEGIEYHFVKFNDLVGIVVDY